MQYNQFMIEAFEKTRGKWRATISRRDGRHLQVEGRWGRKLVTTSDAETTTAALRAPIGLIDTGSVIAPNRVPIEKFWRRANLVE
jgi:hypothetical protein